MSLNLLWTDKIQQRQQTITVSGSSWTPAYPRCSWINFTNTIAFTGVCTPVTGKSQHLYNSSVFATVWKTGQR